MSRKLVRYEAAEGREKVMLWWEVLEEEVVLVVLVLVLVVAVGLMASTLEPDKCKPVSNTLFVMLKSIQETEQEKDKDGQAWWRWLVCVK